MKGFLVWIVVCSMCVLGSATNLSSLAYDQRYSNLFGENNMKVMEDEKTIELILDRKSGSGFISHDNYLYGFFTAKIKLPSDYTAGIVVAFYTSNSHIYQKNHDELDFEFLGNIKGKQWRVQTNVYGNGSTARGREERYNFWFDPTSDFHQYTILWTNDRIIFYIDDVPIRELNEKMGSDFPSKPMSLYATIWDGSSWATSGGRYKVNYNYAPFAAKFTDLSVQGCAVETDGTSPKCYYGTTGSNDTVTTFSGGLTEVQRSKMENFRRTHMTYSYCDDNKRYSRPLPECDRVEDRRSPVADKTRRQLRHSNRKVVQSTFVEDSS